MKLNGKTVFIDGKKYVGEIPDELASKLGLLKKTMPKPDKPKVVK